MRGLPAESSARELASPYPSRSTRPISQFPQAMAAKEAGRPDLPLASLAKEEELVFRPGRSQPIRLSDGSRAKHLLQQVRDETHRFALAYHRTLRGKTGLQSALDEIPGIGEKRKRQLLQRFGSLKRLRGAVGMDAVAVNKNIRELHMSPRERELARVLHVMQELVEEVFLGFLVRRRGSLMPHRNGILLFSDLHYPWFLSNTFFWIKRISRIR